VRFDRLFVNLLHVSAAGEQVEPAAVAGREAGSRFQLRHEGLVDLAGHLGCPVLVDAVVAANGRMLWCSFVSSNRAGGPTDVLLRSGPEATDQEEVQSSRGCRASAASSQNRSPTELERKDRNRGPARVGCYKRFAE
jgi:hypothetical protein